MSGGEGQAKVGLTDLDLALQHLLDVREDAGINVHRHEHTFGVVDADTSGLSEAL